MRKVPVSVCIIAKNEEKHIAECLRRIKSYGFEVVVTDTGSTDRTREIAAQYADKVADFPWCDDFSAARNFCARHAANRHILALDCDEYLESCDTDGLAGQIRAHPRMVGALHIKSIVSGADGQASYVKDNVPRFYDRQYFTYSGTIHEQITHRKGRQPVSGMNFLLPMEVVHHGYALPEDEMRKKQERNLRILYRELETGGMTPYLCFQIGQSELVLGNCGRAVEYYEEGLRLTTDFRPLYVHGMVEGLAKAYVMTGREQEALALMERHEPLCESARFVFYHANVLMDNHEPLRALVKYVKTTMMSDTGVLGNELLYCYRHIIELYHMFGEDDLADVFHARYEECRKMLLN